MLTCVLCVFCREASFVLGPAVRMLILPHLIVRRHSVYFFSASYLFHCTAYSEPFTRHSLNSLGQHVNVTTPEFQQYTWRPNHSNAAIITTQHRNRIYVSTENNRLAISASHNNNNVYLLSSFLLILPINTYFPPDYARCSVLCLRVYGMLDVEGSVLMLVLLLYDSCWYKLVTGKLHTPIHILYTSSLSFCR